MLLRQQSFKRSNPQDQLHQISLENDQLNMIEQMKSKIKKKKSLDKQSPRYKITNARAVAAFNEGSQQFSSWINLSNSDCRHVEPVSYDKIQVLKRKITDKSVNESKLFESFIAKQKSIQQKFLSMAQLCHRYTFINSHGNYNRYCQSQLQLNKEKNQFKIQHASNIELKLDTEDFLISRFKLKTKRRKNHNESFKLPRVAKSQLETQSSNDVFHSQPIYMDKILKLINKSVQKRCTEQDLSTSKEKNQISQQKNSKLKPNCIGKMVHKINWRKNQQNKNTKKNYNQIKIYPKQTDKKQAKFLQECLILNKK